MKRLNKYKIAVRQKYQRDIAAYIKLVYELREEINYLEDEVEDQHDKISELSGEIHSLEKELRFKNEKEEWFEGFVQEVFGIVNFKMSDLKTLGDIEYLKSMVLRQS